MATAITAAPATSAATTTLYHKTLGCLLGGLIGDAIGTPAEGKPYEVLKAHGWIDDFDADGTDDTIMKHLLADALIRTGGHATIDDWAAVWLDRWDDIFGAKLNKFFPSVTHTAHKLRRHSVPRMAALGNMPSSSTAMCFSPVGIVNACNPRAAALQGYNLAALIHGHDVGFCQDGAVAMAAGVAEAFRSRATVASVVAATQDNIIADSGAEMLDLIGRFLELAREDGDYEGFRERAYANADTLFRRIGCDSRETVPVTVALVRARRRRRREVRHLWGQLRPRRGHHRLDVRRPRRRPERGRRHPCGLGGEGAAPHRHRPAGVGPRPGAHGGGQDPGPQGGDLGIRQDRLTAPWRPRFDLLPRLSNGSIFWRRRPDARRRISCAR